MTKIMLCSCLSPFQDGEYGAGRRVHNLKGEGEKEARCTVCGDTKMIKKRKTEEVHE